MKFPVKIAVCLAVWLALDAGLRADDLALNNNPYQPIVARNIFGLNPPTTVEAPPATPPSKITPNGIQNFFGQVKVLFKVAGTAERGKPAKDKFYMLSEGQREDDIEVTRIDEQNGMITFNNHGVVEQLPLTEPKDESAPQHPSPHPGNLMAPRPGMNNFNGGRGVNRFGQPAGFNARNSTGYNNADNGNNGSNGNSFGSGGFSRTYQPQQSQISPTDQMIAIEKQRAALLDNPHPPFPPSLLPPTKLTSLVTGQPPAP